MLRSSAYVFACCAYVSPASFNFWGLLIHESIFSAKEEDLPAQNKCSFPNANCVVALRRLSEIIGTKPQENASIHEMRSEEHTSELQSRPQLVCRLLLEEIK